MYFQAGFYSHQANPYGYMNSTYPFYEARQQTIQGQATWTEGGPVTQCGIPWSHNEYMTVAVGVNTPYRCGQTLKIKNPLTQRELIVTVVDRVRDYAPNRINLHRRGFEALGANPAVGVINVEITPSPELGEEKWGKYLLEVTQAAYPRYRVTNYKFVSKTDLTAAQKKEIYQFILQSPQETIKVQGTVIYNPQTNRVISFDIKEV
ncbi:DUF3889 domain-containing protein [Ammoniphilus sp. CFH 90114]|uniref:DUF3889 domain-containing protein n=1 Tax=Ammoniphilus sp. CFH 90114 TaxID=2493665 RepID=UPI00100DCE31|nr:DUF3889 domain-containing protein [Ammoniphilus sp. CFH 90114]RXT02834.1 DUF3889 domain-containing protein [Ammoniphilus sp. CFH 90114]